MGALVNPVVDPIAKQPESKHTPVRIKAYQSVWQGFILSRQELTVTDSEYRVKIKGEQFYRYELAGTTLPEDWRSCVRKNLCNTAAEDTQWQEYHDSGNGNYRAARIVNNQLETVIFISADSQLAERSWLSSLFVKARLEIPERMALLTGRPPLGVTDVGTIVCACFNVGEKTIRTAIKEKGLKTHLEVGQCLKAGTNCGSCVPEIKALL
jgi:assimilatory nitrate reductase catalytic subunit